MYKYYFIFILFTGISKNKIIILLNIVIKYFKYIVIFAVAKIEFDTENLHRQDMSLPFKELINTI